MLSSSATERERERESEVKIADADIGLITESTFCGSGHLEIVVKPNKERSKCTGFGIDAQNLKIPGIVKGF